MQISGKQNTKCQTNNQDHIGFSVESVCLPDLAFFSLLCIRFT
jgi:hypothetical protein